MFFLPIGVEVVVPPALQQASKQVKILVDLQEVPLNQLRLLSNQSQSQSQSQSQFLFLLNQLLDQSLVEHVEVMFVKQENVVVNTDGVEQLTVIVEPDAKEDLVGIQTNLSLSLLQFQSQSLFQFQSLYQFQSLNLFLQEEHVEVNLVQVVVVSGTIVV
jgi:hypothetical protein